MIVYTKLFC